MSPPLPRDRTPTPGPLSTYDQAAILQFFPPDVRAFVEELAKRTATALANERMCELAEAEKAARAVP